jgi:hypothetical protein
MTSTTPTTVTTVTTYASGTYDVIALANMTVSCSGCNGGQAGSPQFNGSYTSCDGTKRISGNGTKSYVTDCGLVDSFAVSWTVIKNTMSGTLVVTVTDWESKIVVQNSTSEMHGIVTGSWRETAGPTGVITEVTGFVAVSASTTGLTTPESSNQTTSSNSGALTSYSVGAIVVAVLILAAILVMKGKRRHAGADRKTLRCARALCVCV